LSPQITDVEIDFVEKRLLMHFTRHGAVIPKIKERPCKKRKRSEREYTLETTASIADKDRGMLNALYSMVRKIVRCKPKYSVESAGSYHLSFRIREKINVKRYERVWKRYHAHLTSMTFDLDNSTLLLVVSNTS
jgi:hypothetical protein